MTPLKLKMWSLAAQTAADAKVTRGLACFGGVDARQRKEIADLAPERLELGQERGEGDPGWPRAGKKGGLGVGGFHV